MSDEIIQQDPAIAGSISTVDSPVTAVDELVSAIDGSIPVSGWLHHLGQLQEKVALRLRRLADIGAAFALSLIVLPLACLIAVLLAVNGQHPFDSQPRIGRGGRKFDCLKFSTVARDGDVDPTWIGTILRSTGVDELPQLINILIGDMSFVGPRPLTSGEFAGLYPSEAVAYSSVTPGLTGW